MLEYNFRCLLLAPWCTHESTGRWRLRYPDEDDPDDAERHAMRSNYRRIMAIDKSAGRVCFEELTLFL